MVSLSQLNLQRLRFIQTGLRRGVRGCPELGTCGPGGAGVIVGPGSLLLVETRDGSAQPPRAREPGAGGLCPRRARLLGQSLPVPRSLRQRVSLSAGPSRVMGVLPGLEDWAISPMGPSAQSSCPPHSAHLGPCPHPPLRPRTGALHTCPGELSSKLAPPAPLPLPRPRLSLNKPGQLWLGPGPSCYSEPDQGLRPLGS